MDINEQAMKALDVLESSEVLHEFEDSITLRVEREAWDAFVEAGREDDAPTNDHLYAEAVEYMRAWCAAEGLTYEQAFRSKEFLREVNRKLDELGINPNEDEEQTNDH